MIFILPLAKVVWHSWLCRYFFCCCWCFYQQQQSHRVPGERQGRFDLGADGGGNPLRIFSASVGHQGTSANPRRRSLRQIAARAAEGSPVAGHPPVGGVRSVQGGPRGPPVLAKRISDRVRSNRCRQETTARCASSGCHRHRPCSPGVCAPLARRCGLAP